MAEKGAEFTAEILASPASLAEVTPRQRKAKLLGRAWRGILYGWSTYGDGTTATFHVDGGRLSKKRLTGLIIGLRAEQVATRDRNDHGRRNHTYEIEIAHDGCETPSTFRRSMRALARTVARATGQRAIALEITCGG